MNKYSNISHSSRLSSEEILYSLMDLYILKKRNNENYVRWPTLAVKLSFGNDRCWSGFVSFNKPLFMRGKLDTSITSLNTWLAKEVNPIINKWFLLLFWLCFSWCGNLDKSYCLFLFLFLVALRVARVGYEIYQQITVAEKKCSRHPVCLACLTLVESSSYVGYV